jgi:hypothetical protein
VECFEIRSSARVLVHKHDYEEACGRERGGLWEAKISKLLTYTQCVLCSFQMLKLMAGLGGKVAGKQALHSKGLFFGSHEAQ